MIHSNLTKLSLVGLGLVLILGGCSSASTTQAATKGRGQQQRTIPVEVQAATMQNFGQKYTLSGQLEAAQQWQVSPKITGKVMQIMVNTGDVVKKGQEIARLDDQDLSLQLEKAQSSLAASQAHYEETAAPPKSETIQQDKNSVSDAANKYQAAKKNVAYYQAQLDRNQSLYKAGAITKKDLDDAEKSLSDAKSQAASALTTYNNAQEKLKLDQEGTDQATLNASMASVNQSQVDVKVAKTNLANAVITSPTNGVVASVPVNLGDSVSSGTVVAQIIDLSSMKVKTQVSDTQVTTLHTGQTVNVKVAGLNVNLQGKISSISPTVDTTNSFPVEITIPNPNLAAKEGMIATVEIASGTHQAIVVPAAAVVNQENKTYIYTVDQGKAKQIEVKVGDSDGKNTEILSGIKSGEKVVVNGQNTLYPDSPVTIVDPAKDTASNAHSKSESSPNASKWQSKK